MIVFETGEPKVNSPIPDNSGVNGQTAFMRLNSSRVGRQMPIAPYCSRRSLLFHHLWVVSVRKGIHR